MNVASELGYLTLPPNILAPMSESRKLPPEQVILLTTGSQGEPTSALVRIANKEHREVSIIPGDTVVISATPIPGNELPVSRTIDNLLRQGAKVLYDRVATVHVHGHASQEELKLVLSLVQPRYFVPVHGEYRHLTSHAQLAWDLGVAKDGIFLLEDGDVLELTGDTARSDEHITAGPIYVDGLSTRDHQSQVFRQRRSLSHDGVVVVVVTLDRETGQPVDTPTTVASGFMEDSETGQLFLDLGAVVSEKLAGNGLVTEGWDELKTKVRETARGFIANETRRSPMIIPVVMEV